MFNKVRKIKKNKGFTLIEIMVASAVFATVMLLVSGSILSIVSANRKSKNLRSVMDNLNVTLESMTRTIRFGTTYHCGNSVPLNSSLDCPAGDTIITFQSVDGVQLSYYLSGGRIKLLKGGVEYYVTSPDITIDRLKFYVLGSPTFVISPVATCITTDCNQPKVIITLSGYVGQVKEKSTFSLQTTITQRKFDFNL